MPKLRGADWRGPPTNGTWVVSCYTIARTCHTNGKTWSYRTTYIDRYKIGTSCKRVRGVVERSHLIHNRPFSLQKDELTDRPALPYLSALILELESLGARRATRCVLRRLFEAGSTARGGADAVWMQLRGRRGLRTTRSQGTTSRRAQRLSRTTGMSPAPSSLSVDGSCAGRSRATPNGIPTRTSSAQSGFSSLRPCREPQGQRRHPRPAFVHVWLRPQVRSPSSLPSFVCHLNGCSFGARLR